jgi:hypothetical protein
MLSGVSVARIRSKTSVVCDAGPIIHIDELWLKSSVLGDNNEIDITVLGGYSQRS